MFHDVEQNTPEWFQLRCGKIGGSSIGTIMANYGKAFGKPAQELAVKIAIEQLIGKPIVSAYTNAHMQRGHEQEPIARALYEQEYFTEVTNGGFWGNGDCGVSPDGMVGEDGMIEIKSVIFTEQFATISRGKFKPAYKWQLYHNLQETGREWIDYVSFCAEFPEGKRLFVDRVNRKEVIQEFIMIDNRMDQFRIMVDEKKKIIEEL